MEKFEKLIAECSKVVFTPEVEKAAVKLAAFDIMRQLSSEGMISEAQLRYIAEKRKIGIVES